MVEPSNDGSGSDGLRPPPPLPRSLLDMWPVVVVGTAVWFAAFVVLLLVGVDGVWRWTALAGGALGVIGMGVLAWQGAAARRGSRGAQDGL